MIKCLSDLQLSGKRVVIREDFNVPIKDNRVTSDLRIRATLPTIEAVLAQGASVILLSHLGRPEEGKHEAEFSLAPVAECLSQLLKRPVRFVTDYLNGVTLADQEIVLCENVRFNVGEGKDDDALAKRLAALGDVFMMDAFATAHRAQASTHGIAKFVKEVCAGPLLMAELSALSKALAQPQKPVVAIVGGSKVSTKLEVLSALLNKVDHLIVGGGIANTFLAATGVAVGKSLYEPDLIDVAQTLLAEAKRAGKTVPLPSDVVVTNAINAQAPATLRELSAIAQDDLIVDIGPKTCAQYAALIAQAGTVIWNGPVGIFEYPQFAAGTRAVADAIANSRAFSLAGGGDTLAAIDLFHLNDQISYISTGGGAFLEYIEGKTLPAIAILDR